MEIVVEALQIRQKSIAPRGLLGAQHESASRKLKTR